MKLQSRITQAALPWNLHRIKARYRKRAHSEIKMSDKEQIYFYRNQSSVLHFPKSNLGAYSLHSLSIQSCALRCKQTKFERRQNEVELVQPELLKNMKITACQEKRNWSDQALIIVHCMRYAFPVYMTPAAVFYIKDSKRKTKKKKKTKHTK